MQKEIIIEGLDCEYCILRIKNALNRMAPIDQINVNLQEKKALLTLSQEIPDSILREAIENDEAGYDVVSIRTV